MSLTIILLSICGISFLGFLFTLLYMSMTAPIAMPYIKAKLGRGVLMILKTDTGRYKLIQVGESYQTKHYGTFVPNPDAIMRVAGVPMVFGSTKLAVVPTPEACAAAEKLEKEHADVYSDLNATAQAAFQKGTISKVDVDALYRYSNNISPNFVEKRIAIRTAEILAQNRDNMGKLFQYVILFVMVLIGGGLAIYMINSGAGAGVVDTVSSVSLGM